MSDPFIGEIRAFPMNFAPVGWLPCDGRLLPIAQNQDLYRVIGTAFGGDLNNFALPDLRGRFAVEASTDWPFGAPRGAARVALAAHELPPHGHRLRAVPVATTGTPGPGVALAPSANGAPAYRVADPTTQLRSDTLQPTGGDPGARTGVRSHENRQPFLGLNYCIAVVGMASGQAAAGAGHAIRAAKPARRTR